jgi:hypothetical protein
MTPAHVGSNFGDRERLAIQLSCFLLRQHPRNLRRLVWPPSALGHEPARCQLGADLAQRALSA